MMRRKPNMTLTKTPMPEQSVEQRLTNFDEVELGYTPEQAMQEAERCLNCPDRYFAARVQREVAANGLKAAVVGGGPAGLTCALSLAESGFTVTVYEKKDHTGGIPSWGIPPLCPASPAAGPAVQAAGGAAQRRHSPEHRP
ncbi:MAG: FAD-dependent oxidoreductase [Eubacteriales bacterium]|nr:FAD-dependent oxidoreductase [Eubacteriales bacterium]